MLQDALQMAYKERVGLDQHTYDLVGDRIQYVYDTLTKLPSEYQAAVSDLLVMCRHCMSLMQFGDFKTPYGKHDFVKIYDAQLAVLTADDGSGDD